MSNDELEALAVPDGPWVLHVPERVTNDTAEKIFEWCQEQGVRRPLVVSGDVQLLDELAMRREGWVHPEALDELVAAWDAEDSQELNDLSDRLWAAVNALRP